MVSDLTLVKQVFDTLKQLKIPVTHQVRPKAYPGLCFNFFDTSPAIQGDGAARLMQANCQVEIYTKNGASHGIAQDIKVAMRAAGWQYVREEDNIEVAVGLYSYAIIFYRHYKPEEE